MNEHAHITIIFVLNLVLWYLLYYNSNPFGFEPSMITYGVAIMSCVASPLSLRV